MSQYSIIAPGTIHSARKYNVAVAMHHTKPDEAYTLKVGLTGPSYNETKSIDFTTDAVKNVEFDVPLLEKGDYNLTAEGVKGVIFKNTTKLTYADLTIHVKIQTDKGAYKPGDEVNFRVLFLDENLKPAVPPENGLIYFEDSKRNRIKEFKNLEVIKGVYTGKFQISEFPVLGYWRIMVGNVGRYSTQVNFEVSKYVLPKYDVQVEATENVNVKDGDMQVVVRSNYTYGKPVNAKVTLIIKLDVYYYGEMENHPLPPNIIRTADMVNGKAKFDINVKDYMFYLPYKTSPSYMSITATVAEDFSDVKLNGTSGSSLYPYRYAMHCHNNCGQFHADKEFEITFQVLHVDGTHVKDTKSPVTLTFIEAIRKDHWWPGKNTETEDEGVEPTIEKRKFTFKSHLNDSSVAAFKATLPSLPEFEHYTTFYDMELAYLDETREIYPIYQYREPKETDPKPTPYEEPKDFFKVEPVYEKDKYSVNIGKEFIIKINSSEPMPYLVYTVVGRGNILDTKRIELPDKPQAYNLTYTPTFLHSPYAKIYLHYIDEKGELKYGESQFHVEVELQNKLEITAPEEVKPGTDVALKIKTAPNSFVGLLAVDQSVLNFRSNNDIHMHDFQWRLGNHDTSTPWQGGYSRYPGEQSGVITLTNANFFYNMTAPEHHSALFADRESAFGVRGFQSNVLKTQMHAAPVAPGAAGAAAADSTTIAVRKDFAETWIFADIENTETEEFVWAKKIPDTITSWVLTGFSINPEKGLGVTNGSTTVKTFLPFFVSVRLPYSVKRGEVINVPALVFNYLEKDLDVEVTLDNTDGEFEFTDVSNEVINEEKRVRSVRVPANSARGVSFLLRPKIIGNILLKFTAVSPIAGDAVHKSLKVVPEGVTEYANRAYLVNLKDAPEFKDSFALELPKEVVPDSQHIEFSVVGDLLGPMLNNLDNLVRMPTGCGEQTMSKMVPNYLILRYLKSINKLTPDLKFRIERNLELGYQHILSFAHTDGSFSSFGPPKKDDEHPHNGSTWLTAYVVRSLTEAQEFINVDPEVLQNGLNFLATKQAENGSFTEGGDYFYSSQKNHITLTASVLLAFLANETTAANYTKQIDNGFKYILENIEKEEDLHAKALATFTLHKAKHALAADQLSHLKTLAKSDEDRMWWSPDKVQRPPLIGCCWWRYPFTKEVEITSYILLTLLDTPTESVESVLPIIKWLVAQRNSYGGFSSTQDTVVGLMALVKFAQKSGYEAAEMEIDVASKGGIEKRETVKANAENSLLLQSVELPQKTTALDFHAKGKGAALVQISYQYNIVEKDPKPSFSIKTTINKDVPAFKLQLQVCVEYIGEEKSSNMAVLEISLPSGYVADVESFEQIKAVDRVRHTETKNGNTVVVVYFESLHKGESQCLPVEGFKAFAVAMQKPSSVVLYDYYDTTKKATDYYEVVSKLCDICDDDEECKKVCN